METMIQAKNHFDSESTHDSTQNRLKYGLAELCHRLFSLKIGSIVLLERQKYLSTEKKLDLPNFGNFEKDLKCSIFLNNLSSKLTEL